MPARKPRQTGTGRARLDILAAGEDEAKFLEVALEMLESPQRLEREAALEVIARRPSPAVRAPLRSLYDELDADGSRRDQGCNMRASIVSVLAEIGDNRDVPIAIRAVNTTEKVFGDDVSYGLRMRGLQMLAQVAPEEFPYYAIERLDDHTRHDDEPAATAIRLLAATGNFVPLYQWLRGPGMDSPNFIRGFDALSDAPPEIVRRFVDGAIATAMRRQDETLCTVLAEAVVNLEIENLYEALGALMSGRISDELYSYLAMLFAGTNRGALLQILETQLHKGRRPKLVLAALSVRPTDEQRAIIERWESR